MRLKISKLWSAGFISVALAALVAFNALSPTLYAAFVISDDGQTITDTDIPNLVSNIRGRTTTIPCGTYTRNANGVYEQNNSECDNSNVKITESNGTFSVTSDNGFVTSFQRDQVTELDNDANVLTEEEAAAAEEEGEVGTAGTEDLSCFSTFPVVGWILCGVLVLMVGTVEQLLSAIVGGEDFSNLTITFGDEVDAEDRDTILLPDGIPVIGDSGKEVDTLDFNVDNEKSKALLAEEGSRLSGIYKTWQAFRLLARITFVLAFLYMVYAVTVSNTNAYGLKKLAPRLLLAFILVEASFFLSRYAVSLSNNFGIAIALLFDNYIINSDTPFQPAALFLNSGTGGGVVDAGFDPSAWVNEFFAGALVVGAVSLTLVAAGSTLFLTMLGAIITLVLVYFVLIFRQLIVLLLVAVSPLAAIAWIHPQTDGLAKAWWQTFSKALLMFPLIVLLLKFGELLARAATTEGVQDPTNDLNFNLVRFVAYLAPYFLIPFTFRFAGGAIAQIAGAGDRAKGGLLNERKRLAAQKDQERVARVRDNLGRQEYLKGGKDNGIRDRTRKLGAFAASKNKGARAKSAASDRFEQILGKNVEGADGESSRERIDAETRRGRVKERVDAEQSAIAIESMNREMATDEYKQRSVDDISTQVAANGPEYADKKVAELEEANQEIYDNAEVDTEGRPILNAEQEGKINSNNASIAGYKAARGWWTGRKRTAAQKQAYIIANAANGYGLSEGVEGYNELMDSASEISGVTLGTREDGSRFVEPGSGGNIDLHRAIMNQAQYSANSAGRWDVGGPNQAAGFDINGGLVKPSAPQLAQGKKESIMAHGTAIKTMMYELATNQDSQTGAALTPEGVQARQQQIGVHYNTLRDSFRYANAGNKKAITKVVKDVTSVGATGSVTIPGPDGTTRSVQVPTGQTVTEMVDATDAAGQVIYDQKPNPQHAIVDRYGKPMGPEFISVPRKVQKTRTVGTPVTIQDIMNDEKLGAQINASSSFGGFGFDDKGQPVNEYEERRKRFGNVDIDDDHRVMEEEYRRSLEEEQ